MESIKYYTGAWVYMNGSFTKVYPKETNHRIHTSETLQYFCDDIGTPQNFNSYRSPDNCDRNSALLSLAKNRRIHLTFSDPGQSNHMWKVNIETRRLKKMHHKNTTYNKVPNGLWDFGIKYQAKMMHYFHLLRIGEYTSHFLILDNPIICGKSILKPTD